MTRSTTGRKRPKATRQAAPVGVGRRGWWYAVVAAGLVLVLGGAWLLGGSDDGDAEPESGLVASFEMLDGSDGQLADYRGRPLVMNFFASWCVPCLAEMPGFEQVHQEVKAEVGFLGVNLQDAVENGRAVVEATGVSYDIARDPDGTLFTEVGGTAMPTTVFIDTNGAIVDLHSGEISADALRDRIEAVLLS